VSQCRTTRPPQTIFDGPGTRRCRSRPRHQPQQGVCPTISGAAPCPGTAGSGHQAPNPAPHAAAAASILTTTAGTARRRPLSRTGHLESRSGLPGTGSELTWPGPAAPAVAAVAIKRGRGEHAEEKESPPPSPAPARALASTAVAVTALPAELHAAHARGGAVGLLPHAPPRERRKAPPPPSLPAGRPAPAAARRGRGGEGLLGFGGRSRPSHSRGSDAGELYPSK